MTKLGRSFWPLLALLLLVLGCTSHRVVRQAQLAEQAGDWDQVVLHYLEAVRTYPDNLTYRAGLMRAKIQAAQEHFRKGRRFQEAGVLERALIEYRQAVELDPSNQLAEAEMRKVLEEIRALQESREPPGTIAEMKERRKRLQPPMLNPRSNEPISVSFPEEISTKDIYQALGKAFGINVLFDPNLRDKEISIELVDVTAVSALEIVMRTVGNFYKVLDEHTIIIADDTPQNRRNYEDQVIQTFFLSNAEVKDVLTMVRSLVQAKHVAQNEQLNAIVMRDTADKVKIAEQIIQTNDKAKAEVVIDVELLQINTNKMRELGLALSQNSISATLDLGGDNVPLRLSDVEFLNANNWVLSVPSFIFNFMKQAGEAQLLAQPKVRITEGETATLTIGDRVPIPTTTFNTAGTNNGGVLPTTSFTYQDVGIQIDIEPRVHHNEEVSLKLTVEVSNLAGEVQGPNGQAQPIIGTRTIESSIRLRNGETNFLAGLIRAEETQSETGIPGLSDIPILGRLFKNNSREKSRTDIVLTLTPHIIRRADIQERDLEPIWVGTEANLTFRGGSPRVESPVVGPFDRDEDARSAIQERLRQRMRALPRGLQDANAEGDEPVEEEETGIDLAPSSAPNTPFSRRRNRGEEEN